MEEIDDHSTTLLPFCPLSLTAGDEVVPDYSDFLMGYATPTGNAAYSHKTTGTFYMDVLTRVLDEDAET